MQSNETDDEPRDYEQYIHWQLVALLRGLRLSANLTPAQEQLIKSKAQLIAATIDEDLTSKTLEAQTNAVAWTVMQIDKMHIGRAQDGSDDRLFKGIKNTLRDRYQSEVGVDPAPNYPVRAELQSQLPKKERTE